MKRDLIFVAAMLSLNIFALDITIDKDNVLRDCKINVDKNRVTIIHSTGIWSRRFEKTAPEIEKQMPEDIQRIIQVGRIEQQKQAKEQENARKLNLFIRKHSLHIIDQKLKVIQITPQGALCRTYSYERGYYYNHYNVDPLRGNYMSREYSPERHSYGDIIFVVDLPNGMVDNSYVKENNTCSHRKVVREKDDNSRSHYLLCVKCYFCGEKTEKQIPKSKEISYPKLTNPKKFITLYYLGTHQYKTTAGAIKTVKKYTYSKKIFIKIMQNKVFPTNTK